MVAEEKNLITDFEISLNLCKNEEDLIKVKEIADKIASLYPRWKFKVYHDFIHLKNKITNKPLPSGVFI